MDDLIAVGSKNPVKLRAAKNAFDKFWPLTSWNVEGFDVVSGVADQPMTIGQMEMGVNNRILRLKNRCKDADFYVGMEGGVERIGDRWFSSAWIGVFSSELNTLGVATTPRILIPNDIMKLIREGNELGTACDIVLNVHNNKQGQGFSGMMTRGIVNRDEHYMHAVIYALGYLSYPSWEYSVN